MNALLLIGVMLVGMVYGTLALGVEQHYLQVIIVLVMATRRILFNEFSNQ